VTGPIVSATVASAPAATAAGYAFVLGLVGVANPCGLPLLPAYLSFFVGAPRGGVGRAVRATVASLCVTAGFVSCFAVIGLLLGGVVAGVESAVPGLMIAAGSAMCVLGALTLSGRHLLIPQLRGGTAVRGRGPVTMVSFGLFYALASLGCSLPVFLAGVGDSLDRTGAWAVFRSCIAYALGMGVLLTVLAFAGTTINSGMARVLRVSGRVAQLTAGALLVVSGAYLAYFWAVSLDHPSRTPGLIFAVNSAQADIATWLTANGKWLGLACGAVVVAVLVATALRSDSTPVRQGVDRVEDPSTRSPARALHLQEHP
jgi:cytochrome c-type biogenesis protein